MSSATSGVDSIRVGYQSECEIKFPYFRVILSNPDQTYLT